MADWIWTPFGMVSGVGWGMGVLDGWWSLKGRGNFGGEFNLGRPIVSSGMQWTSLHSCVEVHEMFKLLFGVVIVVGPGTGVLDGGWHAAREREEGLGVSPH